jgi:hypothetical protein
MRLHARAIIRDGRSVFLGSQSLRKLELEARREIGIVVDDQKIAKQMIGIFDKDWSGATPEQQPAEVSDLLNVPAKKVAKKVAKELNIGPAVEQVLDRVMEKNGDFQLESKEVVEGVREAMHEEVHAAVKEALHHLVTAAAAEDEPVPETKNGNR